ncbi:hypothetical protein MZO42_00705 [Sphingomonas psychrotolerans]|uniref:Tetratricopeptide repeat protein n=1 Tax=Sphingomonas psychrotolerans TaxID=1327635 RepID=A0ABU3N1V6_9SPHN|nr:hypothetical protein [Sphingomonas psychrotolerans]MDT8757205.1 hypothetical protein [Sphingomonas psychrotolerans]
MEDGSILLDTRPDDHRSFSSLRAILKQLLPLSDPPLRKRLRDIESYLVETGQVTGADGVSEHWRLMADNVTHAIMRRISRESVYTASVIDKAAKLLNAAIPHARAMRAIVRDIDRVDRLTCKVLIRAMLLVEPDSPLVWEWYSQSDPSEDPHDTASAYVGARARLLQQALSIGRPTLKRCGDHRPIQPPPVSHQVDITDLSVALVLQNYDACLLWAPNFFDDERNRAEAFRLLGITLVNVSSPGEACEAWNQASRFAPNEARAAHLHYLRGLVEAKRSYDLAASDREFAAGLALIESGPAHNQEERDLERAWLLNGLALNQAILWRRSGIRNYFAQAFTHLRTAFSIVSGGGSDAHTYLRSNLLANMAFLMEMGGEYAKAVEVFEKVFQERLSGLTDQTGRLRGTLSYRVGLLKWKAGDRRTGFAMLQEALQAETDFGLWSMQEHVLRAMGALRLEEDALPEAAKAFEQGLDISVAERCAHGAREHASGLVQVLLRRGDDAGARSVCASLEEQEGLRLAAWGSAEAGDLRSIAPSAPASKLPAYIPEIDLEGIPKIDLNSFLAARNADAVETFAA